MDEWQLKKVCEALDDVRAVNTLPVDARYTVSSISHKLDLLTTIKDDDSELDPWLANVYSSIWHDLIALCHRLVDQIQRHTGCAPGCLPMDPEDCMMMTLVLDLRWVICDGHDFYARKVSSQASSSPDAP